MELGEVSLPGEDAEVLCAEGGFDDGVRVKSCTLLPALGGAIMA